jgi:ATP-dependent Clp protease ATP-binding subunit ClpA
MLVIDKFLAELEESLSARGVAIDVDASAREYLFEKGYDPTYGARPFARTIDDQIKRPLVDELLFGRLAGGGRVRVHRQGKTLEFSFEN